MESALQSLTHPTRQVNVGGVEYDAAWSLGYLHDAMKGMLCFLEPLLLSQHTHDIIPVFIHEAACER